jgi:hypothetical protein
MSPPCHSRAGGCVVIVFFNRAHAYFQALPATGVGEISPTQEKGEIFDLTLSSVGLFFFSERTGSEAIRRLSMPEAAPTRQGS